MKIVKKIIISIITLFLIPNMVLADCAVAQYSNYKAKVINKDGANTYESKYNDSTKQYEYTKKETIIPYETIIEIKYDEIKDGDIYLLNVEYNKDNYIVRANDLLNIDEYKKSEITFKDYGYYTILDTEVRSGPGVLYDVIGTIKKDTKIKMDHEPIIGGFDGGDVNNGSWILITDGIIEGYVPYYACFGGFGITIGKKTDKENKEYYYVGNDDSVKELHFGDKVKILYEVEHSHGFSYYIEIGENRYEIYNEYIGTKSSETLIPIDISDTVLNDVDSNIDVKASTLFKRKNMYAIEYISDVEWGKDCYIKINNKYYKYPVQESYYYSGEYVLDSIIVKEKEKISFDKDMNYGFKKSEKGIIKKGETIEAYKVLGEDMYYNDVIGFIYNKENNDENFVTNTTTRTTTTKKNVDKEKQNEKIVTNKYNSRYYLKICLIISSILAIVGATLLILINNPKALNKILHRKK